MDTLSEPLVRCPHCKEHKPQSHYQKNRAMKSGFEHWCRPCKSVDSKERRKRRVLAGFCPCGRKRYKKNKTCIVCIERGRKWLRENKEYSDQLDAKYRARIKDTIFEHYGRRCVCCDAGHFEWLTIDHINGGGNKHRKEVKAGGNAFYVWLIKNSFPEEFRTLCYNCNCCRGHLGYCPCERQRLDMASALAAIPVKNIIIV